MMAIHGRNQRQPNHDEHPPDSHDPAHRLHSRLIFLRNHTQRCRTLRCPLQVEREQSLQDLLVSQLVTNACGVRVGVVGMGLLSRWQAVCRNPSMPCAGCECDRCSLLPAYDAGQHHPPRRRAGQRLAHVDLASIGHCSVTMAAALWHRPRPLRTMKRRRSCGRRSRMGR